MEDSHTVHLHLPPPDAQASSAPKDQDSALSTASNDIPVQPAGSTVSSDQQDQQGNALFGVFDGHGGSTVAKFTGSTLHTRLQGLESYSTCCICFGELSLYRHALIASQRKGSTKLP